MTRKFSSPPTYESNDRQMVPFFYTDYMTLSSTLSNYFEFNVIQRKSDYHYNPVYSDPLTTDLKLSTDELTGYLTEAGSSTTLPMSEFKYSSIQAEQRIKRIAKGA